MPRHDDDEPRLPDSARYGFAGAFTLIAGLMLLMAVVGPLIDADYKVDAIIVIATIPFLIGAALLTIGITLPDWWRR